MQASLHYHARDAIGGAHDTDEKGRARLLRPGTRRARVAVRVRAGPDARLGGRAPEHGRHDLPALEPDARRWPGREPVARVGGGSTAPLLPDQRGRSRRPRRIPPGMGQVSDGRRQHPEGRREKVSAPHGDRIVAGYLAQLELELGGLPGARRQEILDEIREHIEEARGRIPNESDSDVLNVLDRLGEPAEVASAARPDSAASLPMSVAHGSIWTSGWLDIAAAVLTPVVWPVGVILLWMSSAWSVRDKLIGTLVPPGGYIGVFFGLPLFFLIGNTGGSTCMSGTDAAGNPYH